MKNTMDGKHGNVADLERHFPDGRLVGDPDGKVYDYRKMMEAVKEKGRPLTMEESADFLVG